MVRLQRGFTLIELIVVIVILGILAAFALPRFAGLDEQAQKAVTEGLAGSIRSGAALAHGKALATRAAASGSISMEDQTIDLAFKYPATAQIGRVLSSTAGFTSSTAGSATRFAPDNVADSANCHVDYEAPSAANTPPTITLVTTDCS